jgi:hypothetical protein
VITSTADKAAVQVRWCTCLRGKTMQQLFVHVDGRSRCAAAAAGWKKAHTCWVCGPAALLHCILKEVQWVWREAAASAAGIHLAASHRLIGQHSQLPRCLTDLCMRMLQAGTVALHQNDCGSRPQRAGLISRKWARTPAGRRPEGHWWAAPPTSTCLMLLSAL